MKQRSATALVVHGHFYQPPRENPWTDAVPREASAAPFANWNERVHAECYRPNAYARIYGLKNHVTAIVNNYANLSFDVGPTLGRWLERHDAQVMRRMRQADEEQRARLHAGGALAQVWGHPITPLLSGHDLRTQIRWGLADFRRRFGRPASGMWLPETAAHHDTLAALIDAGVQFTILAPEQIAAVRPPGGQWLEVTSERLDTGRPYRFLHPDGSGRFLALAVFDGPFSRDLAFGNATKDAASFLEAAQRSSERSEASGKRLLLAASDGELYGHHKKFADLTLAYAVEVAAPARGFEVTNLEAFLSESPPTWEARLRPGENGEGTAWSCPHGLGRWLRDCGCRMSHHPGSSQAWRGPLRRALDLLRDQAARFFEEVGGQWFADPWEARDAYGECADDPLERRRQRLQELGNASLRQDRAGAAKNALLLMEMQRSLLLMYASCAWFFDDVAGTETAFALRRAAHAMDGWRALGGHPPENAFVEVLAEARSNQPKLGTGADAFRRASRARFLPEQVVARAAFSFLVAGAPAEGELPGFDVRGNCLGTRRTVAGEAEVVDRQTGSSTGHAFSAAHDGNGGFACTLGGHRLELDDLDDDAAQALRLRVLAGMAPLTRDARGCQALLAVVGKLGPCTAGEQAVLASGLARALVSYLEGRIEAEQGRPPGGEVERTDWQLALRLADLAGLVEGTDEWRRVQEVVWEHLEALHAHPAAPPAPLRILADRLQLSTPAVRRGS